MLDWLFGSRCAACGRAFEVGVFEALCELCVHHVLEAAPPACLCNGAAPCRLPGCAPLVAPWLYGGATREAVLRLKWSHATEVARQLGAAMADAMRGTCPAEGVTIVPVPAQRDRLRQRGYHPPALLAEVIALRLGLKHRVDALWRRDLGPVRGTDGRAHGPTPCFEACVPRRIRRVWLVDDVVTTGMTLRAATAALREAGVQVEGASVVARAGPSCSGAL